MNRYKVAAWSTFLVVALGNGIAWLTVGIRAHERGNYAGMHFDTATERGIEAMQIRYGGRVAAHLRYGNPNEIKTHYKSGVLFGTRQVRILHFIGPKGEKYCVSVADGITAQREANAIVKGCKF